MAVIEESHKRVFLIRSSMQPTTARALNGVNGIKFLEFETSKVISMSRYLNQFPVNEHLTTILLELVTRLVSFLKLVILPVYTNNRRKLQGWSTLGSRWKLWKRSHNYKQSERYLSSQFWRRRGW